MTDNRPNDFNFDTNQIGLVICDSQHRVFGLPLTGGAHETGLAAVKRRIDNPRSSSWFMGGTRHMSSAFTMTPHCGPQTLRN